MNGVSHWACEVVGNGSVNSKGVKWYWVYYPRREYKGMERRERPNSSPTEVGTLFGYESG